MELPKIPVNERRRLKTLRSLNILDTGYEERFDRLARLAKQMFDVPIVLISLIDEHRHWCKSSIGWDTRQISRETSICAHAILEDDIFVVTDTTQDPRFRNNFLVVGSPFIRFYAGCPLKAPDGSTIGVLCLKDRMPRGFSEEDAVALRDLAYLVEIELARQDMAIKDNLTKVLDRGGFLMQAQHELHLCQRHNMLAVLISIEIDKFEELVEKCGEKQARKVGVELDTLLSSTIRSSDLFARISPNEFAILQINVTGDVSISLNRYKKLLNDYRQDNRARFDIGFLYSVTESDPQDPHSIDELLLRNEMSLGTV